MPKLFDRKNTDENKNAILFLGNDKQIKVKAYGKHGIFKGYLTFIDGLFSLEELQNNSNEMQFFATENINIELGAFDKTKHIVCFAKNFLHIDDNIEDYCDNATLITDFTPKDVSFCFDQTIEYEKYNHIKCVLYFPENLEDDDFDNEKIEKMLSKMPDRFYNVDLFKTQDDFLSYFGTELKCDNFKNIIKYPILNCRKKVAVIDFGISIVLKNLLQSYFDIIFVPFTETALHLKYLYQDKKIDGVIISNFVYNTYFITNDVSQELKKLSTFNIPLLCIGNGAVLIAEILGSTTKIDHSNYNHDTYTVFDLHNIQYEVSNYCNKQIISLSPQLKSTYYATNNKIVGFESTNIIGYIFEFTSNNIETSYFLNKFYSKLR